MEIKDFRIFEAGKKLLYFPSKIALYTIFKHFVCDGCDSEAGYMVKLLRRYLQKN